MDNYESCRFSFESCKSYKDGAVSPNDFARICKSYKLNYKVVMEQVNTDGEGRFSLDAFIQYLRRSSRNAHSHVTSHSSYAHEPDSYIRPNSPTSTRPSSASRITRMSVYPGGNHHHSRSVSRYPVSPTTGREDIDELNDDIPAKRTRTPDNILSTDDKMRQMDRYRSDMYDHTSVSSRSRMGVHSRATMDTPPPIVTTHGSRKYRGDMIAGRSDKARSFKGGDSDDDDVIQDSFYPPVSSSRSRHSKHPPHGDMYDSSKSRRDRLEQPPERLRKDPYEGQDYSYSQLLRDNEKLRLKIQSLMKKLESMPEPDSSYMDKRYEDLKKAFEDELLREKSSHKTYKRECQALRSENNNLRVKNEELQRSNWRLSDENNKLNAKLMDDDHSSMISRRPGDGGSGEASARESIASDQPFQRNSFRQSYHGTTRAEVTKDTSSRSRNKGRGLEMKRVSSEGKPLDYDEPVKETPPYYSKAKTYKSGTSSAGSIMDSFTLPMVSTTPDEQSQVFMVLGEDVSKSVLPEGLAKDNELAMMYALQNCHSVQELIKCLVSYGVSTNSDQLQGFQVENKHLKERVEHLKAKNATISHSFESAKLNMDEMNHTVEKIEANNTRLRHALKLAAQACEAFEVLLELKSRNHPSNGPYFPSFDNSSLDSTLTRSPDREQVSMKHTATYRARTLLHDLDSNMELQSYLPLVRMRQNSGDYHSHQGNWLPGTLSQNTGTTSGLSSMSGGLEGDITQSEIDRLRQYSQALLYYKNHLVTTLVKVNGLKELETLKSCEVTRDCIQPEASGSITDLEDAAHAEELCKVREEKAELRSQIYMMEQEKRRMELEVSRMLIHRLKCDRQIKELHFQVTNEKRKRKKEQKKRKADPSIPTHETNPMSELSIEYTQALDREEATAKRYEDLFLFLQNHIKDSQDTTEHLMMFVKELRKANSALVDAFEKSKKRQQAEKKRMKQELVSYMNRIQGPLPIQDEPTPAGPLHT